MVISHFSLPNVIPGMTM